MEELSNNEKCTYCREYGNLPCNECDEKLLKKQKEMSRLEEIYNECECNKKSEILEAMKQYAEECIKASLDKASQDIHFIDEDGYYFEYLKADEVNDESNIILL